jgi:hypothetical protein
MITRTCIFLYHVYLTINWTRYITIGSTVSIPVATGSMVLPARLGIKGAEVLRTTDVWRLKIINMVRIAVSNHIPDSSF